MFSLPAYVSLMYARCGMSSCCRPECSLVSPKGFYTGGKADCRGVFVLARPVEVCDATFREWEDLASGINLEY